MFMFAQKRRYVVHHPVSKAAANIVFDTNFFNTNSMPPQRIKKAVIASEPTIEAPASGIPGTPERGAQQQLPTITLAQKQALIENLQLEST